MSRYKVPPARTTMACTPIAASSGSNKRVTSVGSRRTIASAVNQPQIARRLTPFMIAARYFSTLVEMDVRGVLFDFGNTLFAHASLPVTIRECARRLAVPMSDEQATDLADRIDAASMTPDELAHVRDLDA